MCMCVVCAVMGIFCVRFVKQISTPTFVFTISTLRGKPGLLAYLPEMQGWRRGASGASSHTYLPSAQSSKRSEGASSKEAKCGYMSERRFHLSQACCLASDSRLRVEQNCGGARLMNIWGGGLSPRVLLYVLLSSNSSVGSFLRSELPKRQVSMFHLHDLKISRAVLRKTGSQSTT